MKQKLTIKNLSRKKLKENFIYNPFLGTWIHAKDKGFKIKKGTIAGSIDSKGYRKLTIKGQRFSSNRLAFLYMLGDFPKMDVDHKNRIRDDDRWNNLREVSCSLNARNTTVQKRSKSGIKGVCFEKKTKTWRATLSINRKTIEISKRYKNIYFAVLERYKFEKKHNFFKNDSESSAYLYLKNIGMI